MDTSDKIPGALESPLEGKEWMESEGESMYEDEGESCSEVERTEDDTSCSEVDRKGKGDGGEHVCPYAGCGAAFKKVGKLNRHVLTHTGERPFACTYPGCDKRFTRIQHLKRHGAVHTGERPFPCTHPGCTLAFTVSSHLTRHLLKHQTKKPYACAHEGCGESFTKQNQLKRHMCKHNNQLPYVCTYDGCGQGFNFPSLLKRHINRHHLGVSEKTYVCGEENCCMEFPKHSLLLAHVRENHAVPYKHECTECDKKYKRKKDLEIHMGTHFPEKRKLFYCEEEGCTKSFTSESNLRSHIRSTHTGEKSFVCNLCISPESTPTSPNTQDNTTSTPPICGKQFAHKHALERHMKTHTNPKTKSKSQKDNDAQQPPKKKTKSNASIVAKLVGVATLPPLLSSPPSIPSPNVAISSF